MVHLCGQNISLNKWLYRTLLASVGETEFGQGITWNENLLKWKGGILDGK